MINRQAKITTVLKKLGYGDNFSPLQPREVYDNITTKAEARDEIRGPCYRERNLRLCQVAMLILVKISNSLQYDSLN